jgi:hypothetical protein
MEKGKTKKTKKQKRKRRKIASWDTLLNARNFERSHWNCNYAHKIMYSTWHH